MKFIISNIIGCIYHLIMAVLSLFGLRSLARKVRQIYQVINVVRYW